MSPPRRPWAIVAVLWFTLAVTYGVFFSFSIFFVALIEEFHWSRALTAGAFSASTIVQGLLQPVCGAVIDRIGPRRLMVGGTVLVGVSGLLGATVQAPWQLYLYTGVLGAAGLVGLGWVPAGVLLSRWVAERRGRVTGLAFSGMGIGVFVMGPLAQWLIATWGWRVATAAQGGLVLVVLLPIVWLGIHDAPRSEEARRSVVTEPRGAPPPARPAAPGPTVAGAVRTRAFWGLLFAYFLTPLAVFPVFMHQVAFAVDLGFPRLLVASFFGLAGLMSSVGRVTFGAIADRLGGPRAATLSYACTAAGALTLLGLERSPHVGWLWAYALLFGIGFGARAPIISAMATDLFAGPRFGLIWGLLNMGNSLGTAIGPWFGGFVHDVTGSYRVAFLSCVVLSALAAASFLLTRRRRA